MSDVLKIGKLLKTDKDGFIVSLSSIGKVISPWKEALEEIKNIYLHELGDSVHSIYVRGTVSRGEAIEGVSDIDTFAVILAKPLEIDKSWVSFAKKGLESKHNFLTGVEFGFIDYKQLFDDEHFNDRFTIKTQSVCIHGEDLAQRIPPFRADIKTASHFHRNLKKVFEKAKAGIAKNHNEKNIKGWCRWVMKRIIRAGFILVMDKEQVFTRDLYPSYELFLKHFPDQEQKMKQALEYAINPTQNATDLVSFLDDFGIWMAEQIETKFAKITTTHSI